MATGNAYFRNIKLIRKSHKWTLLAVLHFTISHMYFWSFDNLNWKFCPSTVDAVGPYIRHCNSWWTCGFHWSSLFWTRVYWSVVVFCILYLLFAVAIFVVRTNHVSVTHPVCLGQQETAANLKLSEVTLGRRGKQTCRTWRTETSVSLLLAEDSWVYYTLINFLLIMHLFIIDTDIE